MRRSRRRQAEQKQKGLRVIVDSQALCEGGDLSHGISTDDKSPKISNASDSAGRLTSGRVRDGSEAGGLDEWPPRLPEGLMEALARRAAVARETQRIGGGETALGFIRAAVGSAKDGVGDPRLWVEMAAAEAIAWLVAYDEAAKGGER